MLHLLILLIINLINLKYQILIHQILIYFMVKLYLSFLLIIFINLDLNLIIIYQL